MNLESSQDFVNVVMATHEHSGRKTDERKRRLTGDDCRHDNITEKQKGEMSEDVHTNDASVGHVKISYRCSSQNTPKLYVKTVSNVLIAIEKCPYTLICAEIRW